MIRVEVYRQAGKIVRFSLSGHAGFAEHGYDIVCSAVSALILNAINSCEKFLGVELSVEDDGSTLRCKVPASKDSPEVQLLLESMLFGVEQTSSEYPRHVKVFEVDKE